MRKHIDGFTLVELLVVISIIVALLALLAPALDKAVYEAELVSCSARQHGIVVGVAAYAAQHKRHYPYRPVVRDSNNSAWLLRIDNTAGLARAAATEVYDDRPALRSYLTINGLQCPLNKALDLDTSAAGQVGSSYNMWFGFRYGNRQGMYKQGDRWVWSWQSDRWEFDVMATDRNELYGEQDNSRAAQAAHPDADGVLAPVYYQDSGPAPGIQLTYAYWENTRTYERGPLDLNALFQDGAVHRYRRVKTYKDEPNWIAVPFWASDREYGNGQGQNIFVPLR
jgi:prepilin-type N-terminal cleavage/methylation domain-containing protein